MKWPETNKEYLKSDTTEVSVQVNGKMRSRISVPSGSTDEEALTIAKNDENVAKYLVDKKLERSIYVPGRIVNFVTKN
jgi:leucyl-tRNA synthetase